MNDQVRERVRQILHVGQHLPELDRREIIALGATAVPALVEILEDDDLALATAPSEGFGPIHAAVLLGELRAPEAIQPMLHILEDGDDLSYLHDRVLQSLPEIGAPVVEPALEAYAASADSRSKRSIASVLAATQIHDDRVFAVLIDNLRADASCGAGALAEYGDPRAIEHLSRALDECPIEEREGLFTNHAFVELRAAIEELGGSLTVAQELRA